MQFQYGIYRTTKILEYTIVISECSKEIIILATKALYMLIAKTKVINKIHFLNLLCL